ncbi:MAG: hypothetical protein E7591_00940 [Ruminococcaceae bacterium]|nr:hypothetical protein [Oscillospiraceae bacterium]
MSNFGTIYNELKEIRDRANAKTGSNDTNISDAVDTLISGFGKGNGTVTPSGTKQIVTNGTHNVSTYEYAEVNVPVGITPSGTLDISSNGTFDVTNYATANVAIPTISVVRRITLANDLGAADPYQYNQTVISGDDFVKEHYNDTGLLALLIPMEAIGLVPNTVNWIIQSNSPLYYNGTTPYYGASPTALSASNITLSSLPISTKLTSRLYTNASALLLDSSGNVNICGGGTSAKPRIVKAGTYLLILSVAR